MMLPLEFELLAADRARELRREAAAARLVALARCCRPHAWVTVARRMRTAARALAGWSRSSGASGCCPAT